AVDVEMRFARAIGSAAAPRGISVRPILDQRRMIIATLGCAHPERLQNRSGSNVAQRLPADTLYDLAEQKISGIAVEILCPGRKIQRLLPRDDRERVGIAKHT